MSDLNGKKLLKLALGPVFKWQLCCTATLHATILQCGSKSECLILHIGCSDLEWLCQRHSNPNFLFGIQMTFKI